MLHGHALARTEQTQILMLGHSQTNCPNSGCMDIAHGLPCAAYSKPLQPSYTDGGCSLPATGPHQCHRAQRNEPRPHSYSQHLCMLTGLLSCAQRCACTAPIPALLCSRCRETPWHSLHSPPGRQSSKEWLKPCPLLLMSTTRPSASTNTKKQVCEPQKLKPEAESMAWQETFSLEVMAQMWHLTISYLSSNTTPDA